VQYLPPLLEEMHALSSQLEAEEEKAMMGGLCVLVAAIGRWAYQAKKEEEEQINIVLFVSEN
jgi:hypothetical protein